MTRAEIRESLRAFLALLDAAPPSGSAEDALEPLALALDRLALAQHFVAFQFDPRDHPDPPDRPYAEWRARVTERFPQLGLYNIAGSTTTTEGQSGSVVGDAVDDVADIARGVAEVEWRWEHTSEDDALWFFQNNFAHHWGDHLRALQLYLHRSRDGL